MFKKINFVHLKIITYKFKPGWYKTETRKQDLSWFSFKLHSNQTRRASLDRSQERLLIHSLVWVRLIGGHLERWQDGVATSTPRPANDQRGYMALKQWPRNQENWMKLLPTDATNRPSSEKIERLFFINSSCKHCFGKNSPSIDALWCKKRTFQR